MDFVALSQKTIQGARDLAKARGASRERGLRSPLGKLLLKAAYGQGGTPRMTVKQAQSYSLELIPVRIRPGKRPLR
jgi:hypothetical protein